jgi:hypothetical protein
LQQRFNNARRAKMTAVQQEEKPMRTARGKPETPPAGGNDVAVAAPKKREAGMIVPNRVQMAEHGRNHFVATAPSGAQPEDFLKAEYWGMVSKTMKPYDLVEVRTDEGTFWGLYIILASDRTWARLHPLLEVRLPSAEAQEISKDYKIEWKGPHMKYCVIRLSDSSAVHEGEQERRGAEEWLSGYLRTIGKPVGVPG